MSKKAAAFLAAMQQTSPEAPPEASPTPAPASSPAAPAQAPQVRATRTRGKAPKPPRADLTHFGGYLETEIFEKIDLLKRRLKLDNSALIKLAIEDLYRKHMAKKAFGDA